MAKLKIEIDPKTLDIDTLIDSVGYHAAEILHYKLSTDTLFYDTETRAVDSRRDEWSPDGHLRDGWEVEWSSKKKCFILRNHTQQALYLFEGNGPRGSRIYPKGNKPLKFYYNHTWVVAPSVRTNEDAVDLFHDMIYSYAEDAIEEAGSFHRNFIGQEHPDDWFDTPDDDWPDIDFDDTSDAPFDRIIERAEEVAAMPRRSKMEIFKDAFTRVKRYASSVGGKFKSAIKKQTGTLHDALKEKRKSFGRKK